jgi:hypothetical protein
VTLKKKLWKNRLKIRQKLSFYCTGFYKYFIIILITVMLIIMNKLPPGCSVKNGRRANKTMLSKKRSSLNRNIRNE